MFDYLAFLHSGTEVATSGGAHQDGEALAQGCIDQLRQLDPERFPPKLFILLASPAYLETATAQQLLDGVHFGFRRAGYPSLNLIGCSVAAVFFNRQVYPKGALLICLASRLLQVEVSAASVVNASPHEVAQTVLESLDLDSDASSDPNPLANRTLFAFLPRSRSDGYLAAKLYDSIRERLWARVPIIGGVSSGYVGGRSFPAGLQFANREADKNLVVAARVTSRTLWGMSVSDNLKPTSYVVRVDELGTNNRSVKSFNGQPAPEMVRQLEQEYTFVAFGKRSFNGESIIELPIVWGDQVKLLREIAEGDSFRVLRADPTNRPNEVTRAITRSIRSIDLQNPVGCLAFKCSGYYASQPKFNFDLSAEIIEVEESLGIKDNFIGGFVDGEAGRDTYGRSQIRTWSTSAVVFGDELRHRTSFQQAFERLSDFLNRYPAPDESMEGSVDALVKMIYSIGFPGVRLLLQLNDSTGPALVAPNASYTAGSFELSDQNAYPFTLRLGTDDNASPEPAATVVRLNKPKFFPPEERNGYGSYYVAPLKNVNHKIVAVLEIDVGSVRRLLSFQEDFLTRIGIIAGASLSRVFNYQETTIRVKLQDTFNKCLEAAEIEEGLHQYLSGALRVLNLRMGHIRLAGPDFKLTLYTGVGEYYEWAAKARPKIDFGESAPTAIAFSRREGASIITNDAQNDAAHQKFIEQLAANSAGSAKQVPSPLRKISSYANIRFECSLQQSASGDPTAGTISLLAQEAWLFKYPQRRVLGAIAAHVESLFLHLTQKTTELIARRQEKEALLREEQAHRAKEEANRHLQFRLNVNPTLTGYDSDNFQATLNTLLGNFCLGVNAVIGSIYLWDEDRSLYVLRAQYHWRRPDFVDKATYTEDSGWFGARSLQGRPRHIPDLYSHYGVDNGNRALKKNSIPGGRYAEFMFGKPLTPSSNVEVLGLPLIVGNRRLGVLALYRPIGADARSGFDPTVVALAKSESSRLALADAALRVSAVIDTFLSHEDDRVESDAQLRRKTISNQLSTHIELESDTSFQLLICQNLVHVYGAAKASLYEVAWNEADPEVELVKSYSRLSGEIENAPVEIDRFFETALENYVAAQTDADLVPDDIHVKRKPVNPQQRSNLDEAATERLVERACLPMFLGPDRMWMVDLHWDTKKPRDYATEAHLRKKYLKQLSEDLSTFSRLWIQTQKRIEAESKAKSLLKTRGGLLGRVAVVAQLAHTWRDEIAKSHDEVRNLKQIDDKADFEKAIDHLSNRLKVHREEAEKFLGLAQKIRLQPLPIEVRTLLGLDENSATISSKRFRDKSIPVQIDFEQDYILYVTPLTMNLAFQNIVDNAIKYTAEVPDPLLRISVRRDGDRLFVRFANNGDPIDEKTQDIINNDRYEELDRKWGLVIAKCFAQHDEGDLRIENPESGGTALVFSLRLAQEALTNASTTTRGRESE